MIKCKECYSKYKGKCEGDTAVENSDCAKFSHICNTCNDNQAGFEYNNKYLCLNCLFKDIGIEIVTTSYVIQEEDLKWGMDEEVKVGDEITGEEYYEHGECIGDDCHLFEVMDYIMETYGVKNLFDIQEY